MTTRLAVIGGDGIGPEVVDVALQVLDAVLPGVECTEYDLGARAYARTGEVLPDGVLEELRGHDAILLGAIGDPSVPPGVLERGLLLRLRFELDHHVNLRPVRRFPGVASPVGDQPIDMVVVREGTEGPYVGNGGVLRGGTPHEVATETSLNTAYGIERVVRDAFSRAQARPRRHLTLVHKTNVLVHAGGLWKRVFHSVAADFPDVTTDYQHVDAAAMFFVTDPERFDVVRHGQPLRRHPHRHRCGDRGPASAWPPAATSTPPAPVRPCSSRCTAAHPDIGRPRARRIRRPPCCPWRCCSSTSARGAGGRWRRRRRGPQHPGEATPRPLRWESALLSRLS
jgi:hypothetical protein